MYKDILEHDDVILCTNDIEEERIVNILRKYGEKKERCIVSLSGGVDSMVITTILNKLGYETICIHINYKNRAESDLEAQFLSNWSSYNNIKFYYKEINSFKRADNKRKEYEEETKKIRFSFYKHVLDETKGTSIILGHHQGDIIENVFNNICRGRDILDLTVMKKVSTMFEITIDRPLLGIEKKNIYEFAHNYKVPYFKDTTPLWSLRGTFRNKIFPELKATYSGVETNIMSISKQSDQWSDFITEHIFKPFIEIVDFKDKELSVNIEKYKYYPECFWKRIFFILFSKYGLSCPSNNSIKNFTSIIQTNRKVMFTKNSMLHLQDYSMKIIFQ